MTVAQHADVVIEDASCMDGDGLCGLVGVGGGRGKRWPWRARARMAATVGNSLMVTYIYITHLLGLEWDQFGSFQKLGVGDSYRVRDYLLTFDLEPVFEHLRVFTFSQAMLDNLNLYTVVGLPVAITLLLLERHRVGWLQNLLSAADPTWEGSTRSRCLQWYINVFSVTLTFIIAIAPFHLGWPKMHYSCALCAMSCGCFSILSYLVATADTSAVEASGDEEAVTWAAGMAFIRRALQFVVALHAFVLLSAVWKAESLGDDRAALLFGIIETSLVLGYQLFAAVFVFDDVLMAGRVTAHLKPTSSEAAAVVAAAQDG